MIKIVVDGDHSCFWNFYVPQISVIELKFGSYYISLFKPLLPSVCLMCLVGVSICIRVSLTKVHYWFGGLVPDADPVQMTKMSSMFRFHNILCDLPSSFSFSFSFPINRFA